MLNKLSSEDIKEIIIADKKLKYTAEVEMADKKLKHTVEMARINADKEIEIARVISDMSPEALQIYLAQDRNGKKIDRHKYISSLLLFTICTFYH
jgi:hypothetical protein